MKNVGDLFYYLVNGLADKTLSMDMPISALYAQGFGTDWVIDFRVENEEFKIILGTFALTGL